MKVRVKAGGWIAILLVVALGAWGFKSLRASSSSSAGTATAGSAELSGKHDFGQVSPNDPALAKAIPATALDQADKLIDKDAAIFTGTVFKVYTPASGTVHILNFAAQYNQAVSAIIDSKEDKNFPDLKTLVGKKVVVRGQFVDFNGRPEVKLSSPVQLSVIEGAQAEPVPSPAAPHAATAVAAVK